MTQRLRRTPVLLATAGLAAGFLSVTAGQADAIPQRIENAPSSSQLTSYTPSNVHGVGATSSSVTVDWDGPSGATRYRVVWADNPDMTDRERRSVTEGPYEITGLPADSSTWVKVRVVRLYGTRWVGPASTPIELRTDPADGQSPEPTPTPSGSTLFGANYTTAPLVDESVYHNRAKAARIFLGQLDSASFTRNTAVKEALADGVKTFVISWKETDLAAIRTYLAGIPDNLTVYTAFNHEPEDDHGNPGSATYKAWSQEYKHQWSLQSPVMRAQGMIPTNILMAWTIFPKSGRTLAEWTPPKGTVDVYAFDAYYGPDKDPSKLVDAITTATKAAGIERTGIAETGAPKSYSGRVLQTREMRSSILDAGNFDFALYWGSVGPTGYDSRMDAATVDAWFD